MEIFLPTFTSGCSTRGSCLSLHRPSWDPSSTMVPDVLASDLNRLVSLHPADLDDTLGLGTIIIKQMLLT